MSFIALNHLLQDMFTDTEDLRSNSKAVEDYILEFAEIIRAKRIKKPVKPVAPPIVTRFGDDIHITLCRNGTTETICRPRTGLFVYKTNEPTLMEADGIKANPDKEGYTWYIQNYSLFGGKVVTNCMAVEPHEGPALRLLLS